jgi:penicillin-binding protein 1A
MFLLLLLRHGRNRFTLSTVIMGDDLPKIESLAEYRPPVITAVYSDDNRKIGEFYKERRIVVPLSDIQRTLMEAFIAAEDARFYKHKGIDFVSIVRAFFKNSGSR